MRQRVNYCAVNGSGYAVPQIGCSVCGSGCEPLQERCPRCGNDPFTEVGLRLGPLSRSLFLRNFGWRVLIALPLLGWLWWRESVRLPKWESLAGWAQVGLGALIVAALTTMGYHLWLTYRAAQVALVLTPAEAWLYQRRGGRVYFERMSWLECLPPESPRGWRVLEAFSTILHIILHAGLQALALLVPDHVYEFRLRSRLDADRCWRLALAGAQYHPRFTLTYIAYYALPFWLQSGIVQIEPGYEPSPERNFLALDLSTRTLRAYAFNEVRIDEGVFRTKSALSQDAHPAEAGEVTLPAFAMPYGDYWLRAEWGIIKRIESRRTASETASVPLQSPKPA